MTIRTVVAFGTGFAVLVPAWTLPMIVRSGGWLPVSVLVAAVVWLRMARGVGSRPARLAGLVAGVVVVAVLFTPVVVAPLVLLVSRRRAVARELPPVAANEARRVRRLFRLATSGAPEIRAYQLGPFLLAEHDSASRVVVRERTTVAARVLWRDIRAGMVTAGTVALVIAAALW
ncbi:MAG TPA: hypothetical protein VF892_12500, partial [Pseudonocardiaceae bacterium]